MQPVSTLPKGRTHQMRPIQRPPSWIEAILHRPIRVECWSCLRPSWLHRNQKNESPSDWTCPHCKTHQCRDKDGNIVPVPEMFDESLNEDVTKRISYSLKNRRIAGDNDIRQTSRNDIFCEMCSGHQRVVYQLLSNYIPDEEDENYEAYYDSAETYRRQLEERYPLACVRCLDKVQKELAQQGHQIKSSLLNATLSKSRGDNIRPARKYPSIGWLFTGCSYLCAHTALLSTEIIGMNLYHCVPSIGTGPTHLYRHMYASNTFP
ncbi:hypothetical protein BX616_001293 [Lobosporangium transversale]|nr:hypothetical protein BX616_001293 [Lobosporangium transversale]